eukprot:scaffold439_cov88-Cylindrotheca_fusiformis.AAC.4
MLRSCRLQCLFLCLIVIAPISSFPVLLSSQHSLQKSRKSPPTCRSFARSASTTNEGYVQVSRSDGSDHKLAYRVARPMALSSNQAAPIVTLHGGPSVPSNYLYPLEQVIPYRSIVFYDQLGCGKSDEPKDKSLYSIADSVQDLKAILKKLGIRRFHLYGQSYGGILAFEYMKHVAEHNDEGDSSKCLSAILSSAPSNIKELENEIDRLMGIFLESNDGACTAEEFVEWFRINHQCRLPEMPSILGDAYDNAGTVWSGTAAIYDYVAEPPSAAASRMPSTLLMRGEFDFVSEESAIMAWKAAFNTKFVRCKTLKGCSHHGLLENGTIHGEIVDSFFSEYD